MNPLAFFWVFLKASLLSTGGLGNLPFLHRDLLGLGWARESDFVTAIDEIKRGNGAFDPAVVQACVRLYEQGRIEL